MREILFRGKRIDNGEWVYGGYYKEDYTDYIYITFWNSFGLGFMDSCRVCPSTVGQYTGLTDKNGKRIFEGDMLKAERICGGQIWCGSVEWMHGCFCIRGIKDRNTPAIDLFREYEVIGNIHDNPELVKEG